MNPEIKQRISELRRLTASLIYPDEGGDSYVADRWQHIHSSITRCSDELYPFRGTDAEEEASICLALLMGYAASMNRDEEKVRGVVMRAHRVLPLLGSSVLKCGLLAFSYAEVGDEALLREALDIAGRWHADPLPKEERQLMETLSALGGELN